MRLSARLHRPRECREAVHHTLRRTGRARGVDDRRELVAGAHRVPLEWSRRGDDVVPPRVAFAGVVRRERVADARQAGRHAGLHVLPAVELADEQQLRLAVLEDLPDRPGCQRRVQGHRDATRKPDGVVAHQPMRRILREDGDTVAMPQTEALQVRGHASRLVEYLAPRIVEHRAAAQRLRHGHPVGRGLFPEVQALECQRIVGNDRGHLRLSPATGRGPASGKSTEAGPARSAGISSGAVQADRQAPGAPAARPAARTRRERARRTPRSSRSAVRPQRPSSYQSRSISNAWQRWHQVLPPARSWTLPV